MCAYDIKRTTETNHLELDYDENIPGTCWVGTNSLIAKTTNMFAVRSEGDNRHGGGTCASHQLFVFAVSFRRRQKIRRVKRKTMLFLLKNKDISLKNKYISSQT